jgi:hypothetical protein
MKQEFNVTELLLSNLTVKFALFVNKLVRFHFINKITKVLNIIFYLF